MKIENRITLKNMKQNKKRTVVTIIGVVLCVTMISSVIIMLNSYRLSMADNVIKRNGFWQYEFVGANYQNANNLIKDKKIKDAALVYKCFSSIDKEGDKSTVYAVPEDKLDLVGYPLIEGKYPTKDHELLVSNYYLNKNHIKIGDIITCNNVEDSVTRELIKNNKFKVVGITDSYWDYIGESTFIAKYDKTIAKDQKIQAYITFDSLWNTEEQIKYLQHTYFMNQSSKMLEQGCKVESNYDLLKFLILKDSKSYKGFILAGGFVCLIIMISGICVIYNSFTISLSERTQYLGMLSSMGATRKQKKQMIRFEAFVIGSIALPIGFLFAMGLVNSLLFLCRDKITKNSVGGLVLTMHLHWSIFLFVSLFTLFLLWGASYLPAKRASKINAVESIRKIHDIKIMKKHYRAYPIYRKMFGIEGVLAIKNMKRHPFRYRSVLASLVVSFVLVTSVLSFSDIIKKTIIKEWNSYYDIMLTQYTDNNEIQLYDEKELEKYKNISHADEKHMFLTARYRIYWEQFISDEGKNIVENLSEKGILNQNSFSNLNVIGVQDHELADYCKALGISIDKLKKMDGYILVNRPIKDNGQIHKMMWVNYEEMEKFKIYFQCNDHEKYKELSTPIHIMKNTSIEPTFNICEAKDVLYLIAPFQTVNKMIYKQKQKGGDFYETIEVCYKSQYDEQLERELEQFKAEDVFINNMAENNRKTKDKINLLIFGLYGFVGMLVLIACTNVINIVFTSIQLKSREFAMLKSIGATRKQLDRMILYEGLFYSVKTCIYGGVISIIVAILLSNMFATSFGNQIHISWIGIGISMLILYFLINSIMWISLKKMKRSDVIEMLRKDNI